MSKEIRDGKTVWWLYQGRRVATQANAAGGSVIVDVAVPTGSVARLVSYLHINSGTNTVQIVKTDEDNNDACWFNTVTSAAGTWGEGPNIGTAGSGNGNLLNSVGMLIGPGERLTFRQTGAGAQNDTLTVHVVLLMSTPTEPTWDKSRSTNQANVTLAASTISAANTLQAVVL